MTTAQKDTVKNKAQDHLFVKGFETLTEEVHVDSLEIQGTFPTWLSGTLIRNGPAQFEVGAHPFRHWFDGAAMLHRFAFAGGKVSYANKFIRSPTYEDNKEAGKISYGEFATDPCRSLFKRLASVFSSQQPTSNTNVSVTKLAGEFLAMTETPLPVAFDKETLDTLGVVEWDDALEPVVSTAHPHFDPVREVGFNHLISYGQTSAYSFAVIPNEKPLRRTLLSETKVREPAYIHSFAMTERYLILCEYPFVVNPLNILLSGRPFIENFVWKPERGARFLVVDKENGRLERTYSADAFFAFHHINAFEEGGDIVLDISAYADAAIIQDFYLSELRGEAGGDLTFPEFRRYRLPAEGDRATYNLVSNHPLELPRINEAHNARPYRYAYGHSVRPERPNDFWNALVKVDVETQTSQLWFEDGCYPGEPIFVAAPSQGAEDDGVVLSVVLDGVKNRSYLLVLDAATFEEVARAEVPHPIPFGFHGQFFAD